jgi:hypothetical protein
MKIIFDSNEEKNKYLPRLLKPLNLIACPAKFGGKENGCKVNCNDCWEQSGIFEVSDK